MIQIWNSQKTPHISLLRVSYWVFCGYFGENTQHRTIYICVYIYIYSIRVPGWVLKCLNLITAPGLVSNQPGSVT